MIQAFIEQLRCWSAKQTNILAVAIVGSWARGTAHSASDIDIVIIARDPNYFLADRDWLLNFGSIGSVKQEDWGLVQSLRVFYVDKQEIEFGITSEEWLSDNEIRSDTGKIIGDGMNAIYDPNHLLANALLKARKKP